MDGIRQESAELVGELIQESNNERIGGLNLRSKIRNGEKETLKRMLWHSHNGCVIWKLNPRTGAESRDTMRTSVLVNLVSSAIVLEREKAVRA